MDSFKVKDSDENFKVEILPVPKYPHEIYLSTTQNGLQYSSMLLKTNHQKIKVLVKLLNNILTGETDEA